MKLKDERLQWIYNQANEIKRVVTTVDYARSIRSSYSDDIYRKADNKLHHLALSILMVAMGENIPKSLWTVNDYSVLYGILDDARDELDLSDDQ